MKWLPDGAVGASALARISSYANLRSPAVYKRLFTGVPRSPEYPCTPSG
nr:hypothetical protein [Kibdelosporangium sp. MJ126-NF4]